MISLALLLLATTAPGNEILGNWQSWQKQTSSPGISRNVELPFADPSGTYGDDSLAYGTYFGSAGTETGYGVAVDEDGYVWIVGSTDSKGWPSPETDRLPSDQRAKGVDAFAAKLDPRTGALLYSKKFGGVGTDIAYAVTTAGEGRVVVCGLTTSRDFGTRVDSKRTPLTPATDFDAFVTEIHVANDRVETVVFGGHGDDLAFNLGLSGNGRVFVIGSTNSSDFPSTPDAYKKRFMGMTDIFLVELTDSAMTYSTYFGGYGEDGAYDLTVFEDRVIFVGRTSSPNFPTTDGVFDPDHNGSYDSFITIFSADEPTLQVSTYFGAPRRDEAHGVAVDEDGSIYVTGVARSVAFPVTDKAPDTTHNGGYDGYVSRFDAELTQLQYSTFFGGSEHDVAFDVEVDRFGRASVTGVSYSTDMTTTPFVLSPDFNGYADSFLVVIDASGEHFSYASYLGGGSRDEGNRLAIDGDLVHILGSSYSRNVQVSENAFDQTWNGMADATLQTIQLTPVITGYASSFGQGWPGTNGPPSIVIQNEPVVGDELYMSLRSSVPLPNQSLGLLLFGVNAAKAQTRLGGTLLVNPSGSLSISFRSFVTPRSSRIPNDPNLIDSRAFLQLLVLDAGASHGLAFSEGVALRFGSR